MWRRNPGICSLPQLLPPFILQSAASIKLKKQEKKAQKPPHERKNCNICAGSTALQLTQGMLTFSRPWDSWI